MSDTSALSSFPQHHAVLLALGLFICRAHFCPYVVRIDARRQRLRLELKQFSTGKDHPCASHPIIDISGEITLWAAISVMIEICGPLLLLLLTEPLQSQVNDRLFLFDWMTGELLVVRVQTVLVIKSLCL